MIIKVELSVKCATRDQVQWVEIIHEIEFLFSYVFKRYFICFSYIETYAYLKKKIREQI